eukprot:2028723-Pyramimonas_sp.AAC.1
MYAKQVASMGCPPWRRDDKMIAASQTLSDIGIITSISFFLGTDSGGDEDKFKAFAMAAAECDGSVNVFSAACLMHQFHLMVQRSLKWSD